MREILFRGKGKDGHWHYGSLVQNNAHTWIHVPAVLDTDSFLIFDVDPDTVGQYTGLTDKNGVKIFEGDIVSAKKGYGFEGDRMGIIIWIDEIAGFGIKWSYREGPTAWEEATMLKMLSRKNSACEHFIAKVIGNIHDNPELLKEMKADGI